MSSLVKKAQDPYEQLMKVLLLGNSGVGKTQILLRYCDNNFKTGYMCTIGVDFKIKKLQVDEKNVKMQIWDTAGQEKYQTLTQNFYKGAMGILLVFALNNKDSLRDIDKWMNQIKQHASENIIKVLIGNKADIKERCISNEEAQSLAEKHGIPYFETSAKDGTNVNEVFLQVAKLINHHHQDQQNGNANKVLSIHQDEKKVDSSCC
ncbi:unnamed protein product (macronuclear) [Paramecium tetraurelia]|uniref:Chromosome undetermined scaffold_110, whole genome shotgun sequence n=1 Tax=Paramecium tetraurelia TaxID=5888 RepID=Q3SD54_PARTE|nr:uncharacterized protein GSPATT00029432001 [Paramecium tetraurelia]CAI44511.1 rab_C17 [Paramecium tetraurelia]CAK58803.1 unnamed protein product [Paramecium tetraurelia]|eukprot:XP_001426201.1 hypothetical protein (macronuclear) [Paramecium tetraurelia strain d4-2]